MDFGANIEEPDNYRDRPLIAAIAKKDELLFGLLLELWNMEHPPHCPGEAKM